ncbi:MAG: NUDIX hydrolase [Deltaproteobacteria bacterium]|nr:MAG: NUDIX hydrolase [Deltaproteobacteria bacterium]
MNHLSGHRNDRIYPPHPLAGVGAVVFHDSRVLLVHRKNPPARGMWAIPGGKIRLGESLQQAAEREILEETGITIMAGEPIFTFDMIDRDATGRVRYHYVIIDLAATYIRGQINAGDDAVSAAWVSAGKMASLSMSPITVRLLRDQFAFG